MYDAVVLGAGITGMTAAYELAVEQNLKVALIDSLTDPGGNHRSANVGPFTFDIGAFVFWPDNEFFRRFPDVVDRGAPVSILQQRICPDGAIRKYPIDITTEIFGRGIFYPLRLAFDIAKSKIQFSKPANSEEYSIYYLGRMLYADSGLKRYMARFCGLEGPYIDIEFAEKRMKWVKEAASIRRILKRAAMKLRRRVLPPNDSIVSQPFVRSAQGFADMYAPVIQKLRCAGVDILLGAALGPIQKTSRGFVSEVDGTIVSSRRLVNTMPFEIVLPLIGESNVDPPSSLPLYTLFVTFAGKRKFESQILFNFHSSGIWKRITMHSDYYGARNGKEYFSIEFLWTEQSAPNSAELLEDFVSHMQSLDLLDGAIELMGMSRTEFAYPLYVRENIAKRDACLFALKRRGVESYGRQGRYDYLPSVAVAANSALEQLAATRK